MNCKRCGKRQASGELTMRGTCALPPERLEACRARMIRNIKAKLEEAGTLLDVMPSPGEVAAARELVNQVLEVLA